MLQVGDVIDRYQVEALLGQGGMAAVFRARHSSLDSLHAVKVLFITAPEPRERLMREGRVQANLRHRNIVGVTDILEVQGAPALVMEYIDGPALDAWLVEHTPTLEEAMFLFRGILRGVMAAHERGVIHRDLKPANVLLAPSNEGVVPKVADFGLTKSVIHKRGTTQTGLAMGTPEYMSPEQIRDASDVDERADMFALGCILYELVTGQRCFQGPDNVTIFNAVINGDYTPPNELVQDLPANIGTAIKYLLEPDREIRLSSGAELFDLLYEEVSGPQLDLASAAAPIEVSGTPDRPATAAGSPLVSAPTQPSANRQGVDLSRIPAPGALGPSGPLAGPATEIQPSPISLAPVQQWKAWALGVMVLLLAGLVAWFLPRGTTASAPAPVTVMVPGTPPEALVGEVDGQAGPKADEPEMVQRVPQPVGADRTGNGSVDARPALKPAVPKSDASSGQQAGDPMTEVAIAGDARAVWLDGPEGRFEMPTSVPPGRYKVQADFGEGLASAGQVVVGSERVQIECQSFLYLCGPK